MDIYTCFGNRRCLRGARLDADENPDNFVGFDEDCQCDNDDSILKLFKRETNAHSRIKRQTGEKMASRTRNSRVLRARNGSTRLARDTNIRTRVKGYRQARGFVQKTANPNLCKKN